MVEPPPAHPIPRIPRLTHTQSSTISQLFPGFSWFFAVDLYPRGSKIRIYTSHIPWSQLHWSHPLDTLPWAQPRCQDTKEPLFPKIRRIREPKVMTFNIRPILTWLHPDFCGLKRDFFTNKQWDSMNKSQDLFNKYRNQQNWDLNPITSNGLRTDQYPRDDRLDAEHPATPMKFSCETTVPGKPNLFLLAQNINISI